MRILFLIIILLLPLNVCAEQIENEFFSIYLPNNFQIETDKTSRIVATGGNQTYDLPFLSIEFGASLDINLIVRDINREIKKYGTVLSESECLQKCTSFYTEFPVEFERVKAYRFHYIFNSEKLDFVISYGEYHSLTNGREFVNSLVKDILEN